MLELIVHQYRAWRLLRRPYVTACAAGGSYHWKSPGAAMPVSVCGYQRMMERDDLSPRNGVGYMNNPHPCPVITDNLTTHFSLNILQSVMLITKQQQKDTRVGREEKVSLASWSERRVDGRQASVPFFLISSEEGKLCSLFFCVGWLPLHFIHTKSQRFVLVIRIHLPHL